MIRLNSTVRSLSSLPARLTRGIAVAGISTIVPHDHQRLKQAGWVVYKALTAQGQIMEKTTQVLAGKAGNSQRLPPQERLFLRLFFAVCLSPSAIATSPTLLTLCPSAVLLASPLQILDWIHCTSRRTARATPAARAIPPSTPDKHQTLIFWMSSLVARCLTLSSIVAKCSP